MQGRREKGPQGPTVPTWDAGKTVGEKAIGGMNGRSGTLDIGSIMILKGL